MKDHKQKIAGWGNFPVADSYVARPENRGAIKIGSGETIARGLGRSYGDAAINTDRYVVGMERINRFLAFDSVSGLLRAEAGVTLEEILEYFVPRGWFLPVTPGTKYATLGGCIAADIHGKNHHVDGTISHHVKGLEVFLADGTAVLCSPNEKKELFWATVGGMGLTGFITEVSLQLIPIETAYMQVSHHPAENLNKILQLLTDSSLEAKYSVAWIDCLSKGKNFGRSVLMNGAHAELSAAEGLKGADPLVIPKGSQFNLPINFPSWVLNPYTISMFNSLYFNFQSRKKEPFLTDYNSYFYPLDGILNWNRLYGRNGFVQYQFVIPFQGADKVMEKILDELTRSQRASFLAVLKRFGRQGEGMLSFPMEGFTLALDLPVSSPEVFTMIETLDDIVLAAGGRVYLAKDACLKPGPFRKMYPRFHEWREEKQKVDPNYGFSSDLSRRLKMEEK